MKAFAYPGTSLFTPDGREVVAWSVEEFESLKSQGCTDERQSTEANEPEPPADPPAVKPKRGGKGVVPSTEPPAVDA